MRDWPLVSSYDDTYLITRLTMCNFQWQNCLAMWANAIGSYGQIFDDCKDTNLFEGWMNILSIKWSYLFDHHLVVQGHIQLYLRICSWSQTDIVVLNVICSRYLWGYFVLIFIVLECWTGAILNDNNFINLNVKGILNNVHESRHTDWSWTFVV